MTRTADKPLTRLRLRADRTLLHEEGACLPLRSRHGRCTACADACPVGALAVTVDAVNLSETCTGCGRCTASCPTQALSLPEVDALLATPPPTAPLRIECRMVPDDWLVPGSAVLPCLGALTPGLLLARAAAGVPVELVDRGWCATCPACGVPASAGAARGAAGAVQATDAAVADAPHPAAAALEAAVLWLQAVGAGSLAPAGDAGPSAPAAPAPVLRREPLPATLRPAALPPAPTGAEPLDRRRFFGAALARPAGRERLGAPAGATPMGGDGRAAYPADARHPAPERARQLAALQLLAAAHDSAVPADFFPQLHADARCCDRRMCVALCPTAALTAADDAVRAQLRFDPARCIACGTCVRACPEGALALAPHGGAAQVQTLATHHRRRCAGCGDVFTPADEVAAVDGAADEPAASAEAAHALCPACTKSRRFMADARRQLFGALN